MIGVNIKKNECMNNINVSDSTVFYREAVVRHIILEGEKLTITQEICGIQANCPNSWYKLWYNVE